MNVIGLDFACDSDVDEFLSLTYDDKEVIGQAIYRRLITPRGSLFEAPDYGIDLRAMMNAGFTQATAGLIQQVVKDEVEKDERINFADVRVTGNGHTMTMNVSITLDTIYGVVPMYLAVSDVTVELLRGEAGVESMYELPSTEVPPVVLTGPAGPVGPMGPMGPAGANGSNGNAAEVTFEAVKLALANANDTISFNNQELTDIALATTDTSAVTPAWLGGGSVSIVDNGEAVIVWDMSEVHPPFANTGTGGTLNLTTDVGTGMDIWPYNGPYGNVCPYICSYTSFATAATSIGEGSNGFSLCCWVRNAFWKSGDVILGKAFGGTVNGQTTDWSFVLQQKTATPAEGVWQAIVYDSDMIGVVAESVIPYNLPLSKWSHIGVTFDGQTLLTYLNGQLVSSGYSYSGGTSVNWGAHGKWYVGGGLNRQFGLPDGFGGGLSDIRIYDEVKDAAFFASMYKPATKL